MIRKLMKASSSTQRYIQAPTNTTTTGTRMGHQLVTPEDSGLAVGPMSTPWSGAFVAVAGGFVAVAGALGVRRGQSRMGPLIRRPVRSGHWPDAGGPRRVPEQWTGWTRPPYES